MFISDGIALLFPDNTVAVERDTLSLEYSVVPTT